MRRQLRHPPNRECGRGRSKARLLTTWWRRFASPVTSAKPFGAQRNGASGLPVARFFDDFPGNVLEVDRFVGERPVLVESCKEQEVFDDEAHPLGLLGNPTHDLGKVIRPRIGAASEEFGVAADGCQRSAEFVGGIGEKAAQLEFRLFAFKECVLQVVRACRSLPCRAAESRCRRLRPAFAGSCHQRLRSQRWQRTHQVA